MIRVRPRRPRGSRPSVSPQAAERLVGPLFRWLKLGDEAASFRAMRAFWDAAGPRIRMHARAERLKGAILFVRVESAAWSQELSILKSALIEKVRKTAGGEEVQDMRFSVGKIEELPDWSRPTAHARQELLPVAEPVPAELERALAGVTDPTLRDELAGLMRLYGVRRKP